MSERHEKWLDLSKGLGGYQSKILNEQISTMANLGEVINLVQRVFNLQIEKEEDQKKRRKDFNLMREILDQVNDHFKNQYNEVNKCMQTFLKHSRMQWTLLTNMEIDLARRARTTIDSIPNYILKRIGEASESHYSLGRNYQLLGVSAFYDNEIDIAERYLEKAKELLDDTTPPEFHFNRAFCHHFLGAIDKSWLHEECSLEANLIKSRDNLQIACDLLANNEDEFLTPLTLVEVLSYQENGREKAQEQLDMLLQKLNLLKREDNLNSNQSNLLVRAYLIRGNIEFLKSNNKGAIKYYDEAIKHKKNNHFAILSKALCIPKNQKSERMDYFRHGLELLESGGALEKNEIVTRLTAVAWGIIAGRELNNDDKIKKYLQNIEAGKRVIRPVAKRTPIFFSPLTKKLMTKENFFESLMGE
jgi:tetratricopeptide (TPR) repeat protein